MENLTHTLVGAALGKAGLDKRVPHAVPILIAAANLPDIEIFSGAFGPNYLDYHRGITHSAIGVVGLSALLAGVIRIGSRIAGRDLATKFHFMPLWGICLVGMMTHPLLDLLNDYGLRPWLPFNSHRYYGDLITIVDPWLWLILGSAVYLMTKSARSRALLSMAGLIASVLIALGAGWLIALRWVLVLGLGLATGRYLRRKSINLCRIAFGVALLYLAVTAVFRESVLKAALDVGQWLVWEQVREIDVLPGRPGSVHRRPTTA